MTEAQIKLKRTEAVLLELISKALGTMNDKRLHDLSIIEVVCSRGKSDAKVYINPNEFKEQEKRDYLKLLRNARPIIETYCLKDQGWYRCPKFTFEFDEQFAKSQKLDDLFKQIAKDKKEEE
ncbi:30S ribosome-binding factor RbfA [Sulfurimonas sp.]|jgi:ribosome-binding factor A|uniref:30S ribosome-binding factor RbfA n=1 Tax=Sulfurimonas sp. TaxID=2022749 RepID=UPI0025DAE549|nr:30S ribosome-binding factor RbfA [Sulfurimonas sp.]MBT5934332.1 30S ribosome-binding factor RbfA [Sulfurimonas sp.]